MSRDYKDAPSHRERSRRPPLADATPRKPAASAQVVAPSPWRWLLGGLGLGLTVAGFAYLVLSPSSRDETPKYVLPAAEDEATPHPAPVAKPVDHLGQEKLMASAALEKPASELAKPAAEQATVAKSELKAADPVKPEPPKYDFYTLLPKQAVEIPNREITRSGVEAAAKGSEAEQAPDKQPESFLMQVGSFRSQPDAEKLRAQVDELGLHASVQSMAGNNGVTWYRVRLGPYADPKEMEKVKKRLQDKGIEPLVMKVK